MVSIDVMVEEEGERREPLDALIFKIAIGEDELGAALLFSVVPLRALLGIYLAGGTTTVTFHRYSDSILLFGV